MAAPKAAPMESSGQMPASPPGGVPPGSGHYYPLTFSVDYPDRDLDRLSTAFRIFWIIPIAILAATVEGGSYTTGSGARYALGGVGILVIPVLLMLLSARSTRAGGTTGICS